MAEQARGAELSTSASNSYVAMVSCDSDTSTPLLPVPNFTHAQSEYLHHLNLVMSTAMSSYFHRMRIRGGGYLLKGTSDIPSISSTYLGSLLREWWGRGMHCLRR